MAVCYSSFIIWRDTDMDAWWERESLVKFQSPTSIFIVAPSGGGKTELTRQILEHADGMFKIPPLIFIVLLFLAENLYRNAKHNQKHTLLSRFAIYGGIKQLGC